MMIGPTGSGKTEVARRVAKVYFKYSDAGQRWLDIQSIDPITYPHSHLSSTCSLLITSL